MLRLAAAVFVLTGLLLFSWLTPARNRAVANSHPVTRTDVQALVLAIQDELYDEGCQGYGADASAKSDHHSYQLPLYVERSFNENGLAWAIYKLLPIGEVLRGFGVAKGGLADVYGHPEWNFPPTEISYRTVYMDDDELCKDKREWIKTSFTVELLPTDARVREAERRQRLRFEGDYRAHKRDCSFHWR